MIEIQRLIREVQLLLSLPQKTLSAWGEVQANLAKARDERANAETAVEMASTAVFGPRWVDWVRRGPQGTLEVRKDLWEDPNSAPSPRLAQAIIDLQRAKELVVKYAREEDKVLRRLDNLPQLSDDPTAGERARRRKGRPAPESRTWEEVRDLLFRALPALNKSRGAEEVSPEALDALEVYYTSPYLKAGRAMGYAPTIRSRVERVESGRIVWYGPTRFVVRGKQELDVTTVRFLLDAASICGELRGTWGGVAIVATPERLLFGPKGEEEIVIE